MIDEFHHAVNNQYRKIIEYFKQQFLLGLTATPERMDGKNIYEICDYNVPYEISLKDGINKGMLVPFHYYGIYDETDYTKLHVVRGKYVEEELNKTYIGNVYRHDLIYKYYCKCGQITGEKYGSHIAEAHHIDYFVNSLNNDANNQMIVCPNHHSVIHDANPVFNRKRMIYRFANGIEEKIKVNKHLM